MNETKPYGYVRKDGGGLFIYGEHQFENPQDHDLVPVYTEAAFIPLQTEIHKLKAERDEIYRLLGSAHLELRQQLEHGYHPNAIKSTLISVGQYAPKLRAKMDELQAKMGDKL
jgi:hypothetical protein